MSKRKAFRDRVRIQVVSADIWRGIQLMNERSIPVYRVRQADDLTYSFQIDRRHLSEAQTLLKKRGDTVALVQTTMLQWVYQSLFGRPVLYAGMVLLLVVSFILPTRILKLEVEGNHIIPERKILEAAEHAGISLFSPCVRVRSERMKNSLLSAIPELQWAGINTYGCRAVISVRERAAAQEEMPEPKTVSSIVAVRDGIIQSVTATRGNVQCRQGQAVKAGQVLISGYTDCGLCIQAEAAQGEIYAQTLRPLSAITPAQCQVRGAQQRVERHYAIVLGKKRINLWKDSGIWEGTCGRISREYRLKLPGGFSMPVTLVCDTIYWDSMEELAVDENSAKRELMDFSRNYLSSQMIAGTILHADEVMEEKPGKFLLSGHYVCSEMIGRERLENGVAHEQSD